MLRKDVISSSQRHQLAPVSMRSVSFAFVTERVLLFAVKLFMRLSGVWKHNCGPSFGKQIATGYFSIALLKYSVGILNDQVPEPDDNFRLGVFSELSFEPTAPHGQQIQVMPCHSLCVTTARLSEARRNLPVMSVS